ncbi:hypothetical protein AGDE_14011 [Angomonas deanei]|uniref:Beige/BEACH domain containing protein, putative n=1 Tax=Angomonas deanei TaxID=59799 RepID=A0A7G2CH09_9TRYP|nr:hypothetical protein AGDE_14011 [Angomonas deanei]CAD2219110.1 Beige/BEACH domain containing protein, putative [Angomonas deanei]|eukprot:EPY21551.1 hypothetical protein AGDE_14011 [Angomonas deanei]
MEGSSSLVWRFFLGNIQVVHQRSFQHLPCALEVVMETGERVFMVALNEEFSFSKSVRDKVVNTVAHLSPRVRVETAAAKKSHLVEATNLWVESALSTRVYLDILNDSASRTAADIGQYPVYPWVLKDYTSSSVNLGDPTLYRDLSRPIGALNENKATQLDRRYRQWTVDDGDTPYHYGTHYSSAAIVLYYLVRVEPFTSLSIHFQGGRLDLPDRLFHSVSESWDSCSGPGSGDVKELIPEFYTISGFLQNKNNTKLGVRRDGVSLGHVEIPPWAHNCDHFRHVHLMALESDRVGERIHEWFNLVFGYKQQGEDAVEAINVFNPLSYHDGVQHAINKAATEEEKRSIVASADNFGQTPPQLFKTPHPVRSRKSEFYPIQNYWIRHVTRVYKLSFPLTATNIPPGLPADQLYNIDGFFYNGSPQHVLSTSSPIQTFHYNRTTDAITCTLAKSQSIVAIVPFILSLGCGAFTCMTVSATGNILAVGTDRGSIVVFTRGGLAGRFSVWDVLHLNRTDNPVISLNLLDQGELIATYEKEAKVTGWHVSLVHSMFLFDTNMEHPSDPSPVMSVCKDKQKRILYGAKSQTVCVFTFDGVVLSRLFVPQCAPDYGLTDITCLCFCNCPSFSTDNILIMGHKGQILSIWDVRSEVTATAEGPVYYSFEVLHTLSVDGEVCSLLDDVPRYCVGVGMENGSITVMGFPPPDNDEK